MECLEEAVFAEPQQVDRETFLPHRQGDVFAYDFPSRIKGANNVFRPAFHCKRNDMVIGYYDGPDIEVVRRYRRYYKTGRIRKNNGTATA